METAGTIVLGGNPLICWVRGGVRLRLTTKGTDRLPRIKRGILQRSKGPVWDCSRWRVQWMVGLRFALVISWQHGSGRNRSRLQKV